MITLRGLILILAFTLGIVSNCVSQDSRLTYVKNDKNPGMAFTMALFIPGSGQMYNDQVELGFAVFAGVPILLGGGILMASSNAYSEGLAYASLGLGGALYLASLIHAPITSRKINRSHGDTAFFDKKQPLPVLSLGLTSNGAGLSLTF